MATASFPRQGLSLLFLMAALGAAQPADALCMDENGVSGYHIPVDKEMHTADAIVLGKVTRKKNLVEDPTDPHGITATIYTLQVSRAIRGKSPTIVRIRSENDSSRFWMDVGQEYLLFLRRDKQHPGLYWVDDCGNSEVASKSEAVLHQIER